MSADITMIVCFAVGLALIRSLLSGDPATCGGVSIRTDGLAVSRGCNPIFLPVRKQPRGKRALGKGGKHVSWNECECLPEGWGGGGNILEKTVSLHHMAQLSHSPIKMFIIMICMCSSPHVRGMSFIRRRMRCGRDSKASVFSPLKRPNAVHHARASPRLMPPRLLAKSSFVPALQLSGPSVYAYMR